MDPRRASAIARLAEEARSAGKAIRAYHGSPHSFSRFDASKIGTGKGDQAYGHGLYFAGAEDVADVYRRSLTALRRTPQEDALEFWRRHVERTGNPRNAVQYAIDDAEESLAEATGIPGAEDRWREIIQHLYALDYRQPVPRRPGHMYEVELGVPEESLLDWDAPIGGQIARLIDEGLVGDLAKEARRMAGLGPQTRRHREVLDRIASGDAGLATGDLLYRAAGRYDPPSGPEGWSRVTNTVNDSITNQARASERLLDAGIPGIRFLDAGSRSAGQGTRNYVMFPGTEDHIRILRKYGLLAPMALPALQGSE